MLIFLLFIYAFTFSGAPDNRTEKINDIQNPDTRDNEQIIINESNVQLTVVEKTSEIEPNGYYFGECRTKGYNYDNDMYFSIPNTQFIKITLLNIIGQEIGVIINEKLNSGSYKIQIKNASLSSGIYFCKYETESFTEIKKFKVIN